MTRRWLIRCGAFLIGTSLTAAAWCASPNSLAERIEQLRHGWKAGETEQAEASAPSPRVGSAAKGQSGDANATARNQASGAGRNGLPQIDARGLMPSRAFGRLTASEGASEGSEVSAAPVQAAAIPTLTAKPTPIARIASRTGDGGSSTVEIAAKDSFTLPGLRSPQPAGSRATNVRATASKTTKTEGKATNTPADDVKPIEITPVDDVADTTSAASPRRSPVHRPTSHFDPDALRNELSGTFAAPSGGAGQSDMQDTSADKSAIDVTAIKGGEPSATAPTTEKPLVLTGKPKSTATAQYDIVKSGAAKASEADRYGQSSASPAKASGHFLNAATSTDHSDAGATPDFAEAARAFSMPRESKEPEKGGAMVLSPFSAPNGPPSKSASDLSKRFADNDSPAASTSTVLVTNQAPAISSDIRGPKQITIGRTATYRIQLRNDGAVAANDLVANVRVPSWAEVVSTTPTHGTIRQGRGDESSETIEWQISQFEPQSGESLELQLIPRNSRPLELGVTWTHAPTGSRAIVEVQEPKLRLQVTGPDEVLFGKPHSYRLTLSNPGTGIAENVRLGLLPPGGGNDSMNTQTIGSLPPNASKTIEVELTAREAGKLSVKAMATADNGLSCEASKDLFCRKPEIEVDWRGPETQYSGTPANYFFRVRNPGTAAADEVAVKVTLPAGAEFVSASEGHARENDKDEVMWKIGSLGPGDDCYMELRCIVHTQGENQVRVKATTADGALTDEKMAVTNVIALADLKLEIVDPSGPVPVGDDAIYEIHIKNRGASAAEDVNVIGLFSAGLDPEAVDGGPFTVADGRVTFRTIRKIPAGQSVALEIRARATEPGTHVFRAEVLCRDLEIKLAAEETTRFYQNDVSREHSSSIQTAVKPAVSEGKVR